MNEVILRNNVAVELSVVYKQTNARIRKSRTILGALAGKLYRLHFTYSKLSIFRENDPIGNHNHAKCKVVNNNYCVKRFSGNREEKKIPIKIFLRWFWKENKKFVFFFLRVNKNVTKTNVLKIESGNQQRKQSNRIGGCLLDGYG